MRTTLYTFLFFITFLLFGVCENSVFADEHKRIGVLVDGPYWYNTPLIDRVKKELDRVNDGQFEIEYPEELSLNGQYDLEKIKIYINELSQRDDLDVIIASGMVSSYLFSEKIPLKVPVVAMDYILPAGLGMLSPKTYQPLNPNWTTTFDPAYVSQTLKLFPKLVNTNRFVIFCPEVTCGLIPKVSELIKSFVGNPKIEVIVETITPENYKEAINKLNNPLVVVEALKSFSDDQMKDLFKLLSDKNIMAFTIDGMNGIKKGALASIHDYNKERLGRNIALKLFDILGNTPPADIPVTNYKSVELIFNLETARKLGYKIPLEFVDVAKMYGSKEKYPELSFENSIKRALKQNFDIKSQALVKDQAFLDVKISERDFFPQISSSLSYNRINKNQADALLGARGETRFDLSLQQRIFDRELSKTIKSNKARQQVEQQTLERINQDIIQQVASIYMDALQSQELVEIRRDYLNIIRKNQNLADLKFKLRETDKSDVLRLNIELENARIDLMDAKNARFLAQARLNNLINLPRETKHKYVLQNFSAENYKARALHFNKYLSTADQLETFRDYFDEEAQNHSPDLKVLKDILGQANIEKERFQSTFYPTLDLDAGYFNQLQDETQSLSAVNRETFNDRFGEGWDAKVVLNFPLFLGGSRHKRVEKANVRILEVESQIQSRKNTLSEQARSGLFEVFRSRRNLNFSFRNVLSSEENLKLAEVAYLEGDLPVIDLLDSQTRLITSQTNAVRNRYQFYRNLFSLFRNVGRIDLIKGINDKEKFGEFLQQVELYFKEHLVKPEKTKNIIKK